LILTRSAGKRVGSKRDYLERLEAIKNAIVQKYGAPDAAKMVQRAFDFASKAHKGQKRESGLDYIDHPLAVAEILTQWELPPELIVAGLLHDVLEDSPSSQAEEQLRQARRQADEELRRIMTLKFRDQLTAQMASEFGADVLEIVDGVTKVDTVVEKSHENRTWENLKRFFDAVGKDLRVVPVKLADRLHNMRTLGDVTDPERRKRVAKETLNLYAPLAYRFGMAEVQRELEDLAFKHLLPRIYDRLFEKLKTADGQRDAALVQAQKTLRKRLDAANIEAEIEVRRKHYYSIYRKMVRQGLTIDQVLDIVGMRVIVGSERDCYRVLGEVNSLWLPIPGTFKDYIARPKPNMYQSLHTVVLIHPGYHLEVQIRTKRMHILAEKGIAAHWRYKAAADRRAVEKLYRDTNISVWVEKFITSQIDKEKGSRLLDDIKTMLEAEDVYVMTPSGEMRSFPKGATLIDFAYSIHTALGHSFVSGKVGGVEKPADYQLKTGDVIEIIGSRTARPKKEWLRFAKTPHAREAIQKWFRDEERRIICQIGKSVLEEKLRMAGVPAKEFYRSPALAAFLDQWGLKDTKDLLVKISTGKIKLMHALQAVLTKNQFEKVHKLSVSKAPPEQDLLDRIRAYAKGLVISDTTSSEVVLAKCCHPVPGDKVIGYIKRGSGVSVHRIECKNVEHILHDSIRAIRDIRWDVSKDASFEVRLSLHSTDRKGVLVDITKTLLGENIDIRQINSETLEDCSILFKMDVMVSSARQLGRAIDALNDIEGMIEVKRS